MTGRRQAHPLLISLANILMDFRMKATNHAFLLLALLPISKFIHKNRKTRGVLENRMIHECLDFILKPLKKAAEVGIMMSDPLGFCRFVFTPIAAYIVDVQEALALSGVAGKMSHITMATYKHFGDPFQHELRMASTTLARLHAIEETVSPWELAQYIKASSSHRLNGVHRPFWRDWPLSEPSIFFTPEPLHHWHKMFWDHDAKWCIHAVGDAEIDFRFTILHPHTGFRQFNEGISRLKQVTGREHRDIQRYIIPVIADAVPKDFLIAIRSLMDFRYLAQAPEISDRICTEIDTVLEEFHDHKHAIISAGARTGKGNRVIDNWYIPKLELLQSVTSNIRENGVAIQWSADVTERCHVTEVKDPLHGNNQEYESQICRSLDRADKCRRFDIATAIHEARVDFRFPINDPGPENNDDDDGLSENPEEEDPLSITTSATLLTHIRPAAPVTGTIRRNANYFELAHSLQQGLYPRSPLPFRTMVQGDTALHLTRDPTMKTMSIEDVMEKFNLPDLHGALADFLTQVNNKNHFHIGGRRIGDRNSLLPFDNLQVWTKTQVQNRSYFPPHQVLPPQTINVSPPSGSWTYGHSDVVLINTDNGKVWPHSGLEGCILYLICILNLYWILIQGIILCNYDLFFVPFHPEELRMLLARTYFLLMLSALISYLSWIRHRQLEKVRIQTHWRECMSWNALNGATGQLWEMLCLCNRLEPSLISSLVLEQMPTSNWPKKRAWSLVWNFGWISISKKNSFMHWNDFYMLPNTMIFQSKYHIRTTRDWSFYWPRHFRPSLLAIVLASFYFTTIDSGTLQIKLIYRLRQWRCWWPSTHWKPDPDGNGRYECKEKHLHHWCY